MCGSYILFSPEEKAEIAEMLREVEERLRLQQVSPTDEVPVFIAAGGDMQLQAMRWGFPQYGRSGVVINARSETALEKPMFKKSLLERRCLIPASAYLEWSGTKKAKLRHTISLPHNEPLYMAGCYQKFAPGELRFVILTTAANYSVREIHDRMPVILEHHELSTWFAADPPFELLWQREHLALRVDPPLPQVIGLT